MFSNYGIARLHLGRDFVLGWTGHGTAANLVDEDVFLSDSKLLEDVELHLQIPCGVIGLADSAQPCVTVIIFVILVGVRTTVGSIRT